MDIPPHSGSHMNNITASRMFEMGLISIMIMNVLHL